MEKDNKVIAVKKHGNTVINRAGALCHPEWVYMIETIKTI